MKVELTINGEKQELALVGRRVAARYKRRFGGRISYLTLITPEGLFDKLYDTNGTLRAIVGEISDDFQETTGVHWHA
ncbi:hypothetical protein J5I95_13765 [Candidatus Poribacteria bacterium]|nr:hypothetical protein [Candidatus Poribacteria bacterium]